MRYRQCKGQVRVAFLFQAGSFWPSWESVIEACQKDERFKIEIFFVPWSKEAGDKDQMEYGEDFLRAMGLSYRRYSHEAVMAYEPHWLIYQTPYDRQHRLPELWSARYRKEGIRIGYIPYGIEISDTAESRDMHFALPVVRNAKAIFVLSEAMGQEYRKYCLNGEAVHVTGLPRFDALQKDFSVAGELQDRIGSRKVVLWKAHFPKDFMEEGKVKTATPELEEYMDFVDYIRQREELFFIFMPHPKFVGKSVRPRLREQAKRLLASLGALENVYIDWQDDYRPSLQRADAIMVDRSAVMIEAGLKGIPVLYLYNKDFDEPMTRPVEKLLDTYEKGTTAKEMSTFCEKLLHTQNNSGTTKRQAAFRECVPFLDGKCAERIKECLWQEAQQAEEVGLPECFLPNTRMALLGSGPAYKKVLQCLEERQDKSISVKILGEGDIEQFGSPSEAYDYVVLGLESGFINKYRQLCSLGMPKERILGYDQLMVLEKFKEPCRNWGLVSVVMTVYAWKSYLVEAIQSILDQTYSCLELLVVVEYGADMTVAKCLQDFANRDCRVKIYYNNQRLGLAESLNVGIREAKGKYIARMDDDDVSLPRRLERQVEYMEGHPEIGLCGTLQQSITPWKVDVTYAPVEPEHLKAEMLFGCQLSHTSIMFRRELFVENNWFYDGSKLAEDYDLWMHILNKTAINNINEPLVKHRFGFGNISLDKGQDLAEEFTEAIGRNLKYYLGISSDKYSAGALCSWRRFPSGLFERELLELLLEELALLQEMDERNKALGFVAPDAFVNMLMHRFRWFYKEIVGRTGMPELFGRVEKYRLQPKLDFRTNILSCLGSLSEVDEEEQDVSQIFRKFLSIPAGAKIVIYGLGEAYQRVLSRWKKDRLIECYEILGVMDAGVKTKEFPMLSMSQLENLDYDWILVSSGKFYHEIKEQLMDQGKVPRKKIAFLEQAWLTCLDIGENNGGKC